jgi:hypothetical protein
VGDANFADKFAVIEKINQVALFADLHQWDRLVQEVFHDKVTVDYTSLFGGEVETLPSSELVARWKTALPGFESTQHLLGSHHVEIDKDTAKAIVHVRANHFLPNTMGGDTWVVGGTYYYELTRTDTGWRVHSSRLAKSYVEGNQHLLALAQQRIRA